jgi:hypothetical protein
MFDAWRRPRAALWMFVCLTAGAHAVHAASLAPAQAAALAPTQAAAPAPVFVSTEARETAKWVLQRSDHRGRPFAIVDKKGAHIYVFDGAGTMVGSTPVLLGLAGGDRDAVVQMGERSPASLAPSERTTPAGRFDSEPGRNDQGEAIVWIDYDAALAIHRLRPAPSLQQRPQRLASLNPLDRRITFGCIVVSEAFYDDVVAPTLGSRRGVVYVLPEERPARAMLRAAEAATPPID